jgi:gamma-glutamyltranspeptidase / glutathione hydrolase
MTPIGPAHAVMAEQCTGRGRDAVVCAAAPLAALAGVDALRAGGNAYDAAVAAALAETVLLPPKCGFGGDLVAVVVEAGSRQPEALLAIGGAPRALAEVATSRRWREVGPTSVGPPAAAAGYAALAERGRLGRGGLAARAIDLALGGFPWAAVCTHLSVQATQLVAEMNPAGTVYYPDGQPITAGALVRLAGLATVLEEWVARGAEMLGGPVGKAIVEAVRSRGGVLDGDDLALATAEWARCASEAAFGRTWWATPSPTHGPSLLDALTSLERGGRPGDLAAQYRAVMASIAARGGAPHDRSGTSMVSAADRDGTVVTVVHSNSFPRFGSGIVVPGYDLVLANRAGRGFDPTPGHSNFPAPGRRPATTLHAWVASDGTGAPRFAGGTPGGANQMPWNLQTLARLASGWESPGELVTAPIWEWLPDDDGVRIERGYADDEDDALRAIVPRAVTTSRWGCKSAQQVVRVPRPGEAVVGAADPRTQGAAIGV